jgi:integrase
LLLQAAEPFWRLVFMVLWETGLRISEVLSRRKKHLLGGGRLEVQRLKKSRPELGAGVVVISVGLEAALLQHAAHMRPGSLLFDRTPQAAWAAVRRAAARAGITRRLHPHLFRHGFGRRIAKTDLGLTALDHEVMLQHMLGHSDAKHTRGYFKPGKTEVDEAWGKVNRPPNPGDG